MRLSALAFLAGILLVQQLADLPSLWWALTLLPLGLLAYYQPRTLPLLFFVFGIAWLTFRAEIILQDRLPAELAGKDLEITGVVTDIPQQNRRRSRFKFDVEQAIYSGRAVRVPSQLLLNAYQERYRFRTGERWRLTVRLKRVHGFQNPGGFDYEAYLFQQRIRARGYVRQRPAPVRLGMAGPAYWIDRLRAELGSRLRARLGDRPLAGILVALVNGDRSGIEPEQWEVLRRTGTNHLMAISGLHIGLLAGLVFLLSRWLWALPGNTVLRWPAIKVGAVCGLIAAGAYAALAGFSIPTQRALVMLAVVFGGVILQRRLAPTQLLAIALGLVLLYDPVAVMGAGFWLSFTAVAIIILTVSAPDRQSWFWRLGKIQLTLAIGLFPLSLILFQQASLIAPVANLIAVPAFTLAIVPLVIASALVEFVLPAALSGPLLSLSHGVLQTLWAFLTYLAGYEHSLWVQHDPVPWTWLTALIGVMLLLAPRGWPGRWIGLIWLAPLFLVRPPGPVGEGEVWFSLLDVGQGLAVVVRTRQHVLVYDAGPRYSRRFDTGRAVVIPYLRHYGINKVDRLIITHGDNDHIGGARSVLQALPVDKVLSSVPKRLPRGKYCLSGQRWRWDGVGFTILSPFSTTARPGNNAGCVLLITSPYGRVLLTADIEARQEKRLVEQFGDRLRADILVAPHHGSRTSSSAGFIQTVQADTVLFPVGYRNRYRHPHPLVVERYRGLGSQIYSTAEHGALEVRMQASGRIITPYRQTRRRYWIAHRF